MKRETVLTHTKIANDVMYYIYKYINTDLCIDEMADNMGVSRFHLQRIFKEVFGSNIYETIKSIRLQKAANLLLTNKYSSISDITELCGYVSHSSFNKVFKDRFGMSPKEWRKGGYISYSEKIIKSSKWAIKGNQDFSEIEPKIVRMKEMHGCYIRHKGYGRGIKNVWQKLQTWAFYNNREDAVQLGLHHDNPAITPLEECNYIACLIFDSKDTMENLNLPVITIPGGIFAKFSLTGKYGDVLNFINWIYHDWFPESDYETNTLPSYAIYERNHFLSDDETFILDYYIPVKYRF